MDTSQTVDPVEALRDLKRRGEAVYFLLVARHAQRGLDRDILDGLELAAQIIDELTQRVPAWIARVDDLQAMLRDDAEAWEGTIALSLDEFKADLLTAVARSAAIHGGATHNTGPAA